MNKVDQNIFLVLKKFINNDIGFDELDKLWIEGYIEEEKEFQYENLLSEISEYIYYGTSSSRTKQDISDGILSSEEVRTKIINDLKEKEELKTYIQHHLR